MKVDKLRKSMASTMSAFESMVTQMSGNTTQTYLIYSHSLLLSKTKFSAYMEDFPQTWIHSNRLDKLIDRLRYRMRVQCVISFGPTQMIDMVGVSLQEVLDSHLDRTYLRISITLIISN